MKVYLLILTCAFIFSGCIQTGSDAGPRPIGGDQDKDGCFIGAGYSWCESKQKCIRLWEEPRDDGKDIDGKKICSKDSECIPFPAECHPHSCINEKSAFMFKPPEVCTEIFDCGAAYKNEDCLCQNGQCMNANEGGRCN